MISDPIEGRTVWRASREKLQWRVVFLIAICVVGGGYALWATIDYARNGDFRQYFYFGIAASLVFLFGLVATIQMVILLALNRWKIMSVEDGKLVVLSGGFGFSYVRVDAADIQSASITRLDGKPPRMTIMLKTGTLLAPQIHLVEGGPILLGKWFEDHFKVTVDIL